MDGRKRHLLDMVNVALSHCRDTGSYFGMKLVQQPRRLLPSFSDRMFNDNQEARRVTATCQQTHSTRPLMYRVRASI